MKRLICTTIYKKDERPIVYNATHEAFVTHGGVLQILWVDRDMIRGSVLCEAFAPGMWDKVEAAWEDVP